MNMKPRVSYEKAMRDRAINDRKGLYTLEVIGASKTPGEIGGRMTMQGPANEEDYKAISDFMLKLMETRQKRQDAPSR